MNKHVNTYERIEPRNSAQTAKGREMLVAMGISYKSQPLPNSVAVYQYQVYWTDTRGNAFRRVFDSLAVAHSFVDSIANCTLDYRLIQIRKS